MIYLGEYNELKVDRQVDFGYYLEDEEKNAVLLPKGSLNGNSIEVGEMVEAFIYKDSKDRLIATLKKPYIQVGEVAYLKIVGTSDFGAFADMGLERDIFIPLKEQKFKLVKGKSYLLYAYVDKTGRLAATTYVDSYIDIGENYNVNDEVYAIAYGRGGDKTIRVAIDGLYQGIILGNEHYEDIYPGDKLKVRVKRLYEDGVIGVTPRKTRFEERDELQEKILDYLKSNGGYMIYNDKSSPEIIREQFKTSKNYFKIALGGLMKAGLIEQSPEGTKLK
ncbi:DNA-binding protein [Clostridium sp. MSJ-8]|uniref:CvfB family protein n=1 Tax=Clostridium sp. MSJ-8 TaxID=2841510 RepID=UPI001C0E90C2|nr:S1-like domain-containing RNA-binding protein [Clostridium sp. MSJ-8]MBU5486839.1 DNA-binding protein [Clostridium sp. MSJ-8]